MKTPTPEPWDKLRDGTIRMVTIALEGVAEEWIHRAPPSQRPAVDAAAARIVPELLAIARSLPRETWEQVARAKLTLAELERTLPREAVAAMPFLPPEVAALIRRGG